MVFYVRRTELQREGGRVLEIADEVLVAEKEKAEKEAIEAARDMDFEEFKQKYVEHIEGRAENERNHADDSDEVEDAAATKPGSAKNKGKETLGTSSQMNVTGRSSSKAGSRAPASRQSQMRSQQSNRSGATDLYKYEIPETCHISMLKKVKIEQLEEKFKLISHPFPQISGEMLVFRPRKEDQTEKDSIIYRDYSLRKRLATAEKTTQSLVEQMNKKKKKSENDL